MGFEVSHCYLSPYGFLMVSFADLVLAYWEMAQARTAMDMTIGRTIMVPDYEPERGDGIQ